jgi:hypothetical protein
MEVHYLFVTNKNWLMVFREILTVECDNQMKPINGPDLGGQVVKGRGK